MTPRRLSSTHVSFPSAAALIAAFAAGCADTPASASPEYTQVCVTQSWVREDDEDCDGGHAGFVHVWIPHSHYVPAVGSPVDRNGGYGVRPASGVRIGRAPAAGRPAGEVKTGIVGTSGGGGGFGTHGGSSGG